MCCCSPSDLTIREDYEAGSGDVYITTTIVDDDNDGVPNEDEDRLPRMVFRSIKILMEMVSLDYLDIDDDGDNVLTEDELDE